MDLVPGNWFELKKLSKKTRTYSLDELINEIREQVNNHATKLDFINISFAKKYQKNSIEDITFYLDNNKFERLKELLVHEKRHPLLTFHGTSENAAKSILNTGYLIPGIDKIQRKHGGAYGIGVYSSGFFDKAIQYTNQSGSYVYLLVNMVFLGVVKMIPPGGCVDKPINNIYSDGSNTHIVYGLDQVISADSNRVIPIALMKIRIK